MQIKNRILSKLLIQNLFVLCSRPPLRIAVMRTMETNRTIELNSEHTII